MKVIPWERLTIDSPLSVAEVRALVARGIRLSTTDDGAYVALEGSVTGDAFSAHVPITYRNSFLPFVRGRIVALATGTRIEATISLHPGVMAFMAIWFGGVGMIFFAVMSRAIFVRPFPLLSLTPLGMFLAGMALVLGGYNYELPRTRKAVRGLLPEGAAPYR